MSIESLLAHYGLAAVALGAGLEGETAVMAGGLLAHRGIFPFWAAALAAFLGSFTADQIFFLIGRRFRTHRWVRKVQDKPAFAKAMGIFERHPTRFILAFRFLYGLRTVSPLAIGTTRLSAKRFLILNMIAAAIWAPLFTAIGYGFAKGLERWFGRLHVPLWAIGAAVIGIALIGFVGHRLIRRRSAAPIDPAEPRPLTAP